MFSESFGWYLINPPFCGFALAHWNRKHFFHFSCKDESSSFVHGYVTCMWLIAPCTCMCAVWVLPVPGCSRPFFYAFFKTKLKRRIFCTKMLEKVRNKLLHLEDKSKKFLVDDHFPVRTRTGWVFWIVRSHWHQHLYPHCTLVWLGSAVILCSFHL